MIKVKESPIHGRGLFAATRIPQGTVIGHLQTADAHENELDGPYVLWVDGEKPVEVTCDFRYINHNDEPNAAYYDDLSVMSLRDIEPGEELTHDYLGDSDQDDVDVAFCDDEPADAVGTA